MLIQIYEFVHEDLDISIDASQMDSPATWIQRTSTDSFMRNNSLIPTPPIQVYGNATIQVCIVS